MGGRLSAGELGKAFLVSRLQSLLQTGRVHLPRTPEAQVLARELQNYEIRLDENANNRLRGLPRRHPRRPHAALGLVVQVDHMSLGGALPNVPGW